MSSTRKRDERRRSVVYQLTLFYALFFGLASAAAGALLYHLVRAHIIGEIDQDISHQAIELNQKLTEGPEVLREEIEAVVAAAGKGDYFVRLLANDGRVIMRSDTSAWPTLPVYRSGGVPSRALGLRMLELPDSRVRARVLTVATDVGRDYLQLGISLGDAEGFLSHLKHYGFMVLGTMLTFGTAVGWGLARKAMAGVHLVTRAAGRIAAGHLSDRVETPGHGREIDELVATFNQMAERVETVLQEMRQMNDNIAHDLRSPLTRIRGLAEAAVMDRTLSGDAAETAGSIVEECDRLMQLINTVLDIAETEAGVQGLEWQDIDLAQLAAQAAELFTGVAEDKSITLSCQSADRIVIKGDRRRLQRVLANLVDNALKYTPAGGAVVIGVAIDGPSAAVSVTDTGPGIAADDMPHLFTRFYRGDRARHVPGNGLGLAFALAVVRAHGGDMDVESSGAGSVFSMRLPVTAI